MLVLLCQNLFGVSPLSIKTINTKKHDHIQLNTTVNLLTLISLRERNQSALWENLIYPGMRQAIVYALECCQSTVEARKVRNMKCKRQQNMLQK